MYAGAAHPAVVRRLGKRSGRAVELLLLHQLVNDAIQLEKRLALLCPRGPEAGDPPRATIR